MATGKITDLPGCIVSATTASFRLVEKRRRRATPVTTSTFENVSHIGVRPTAMLSTLASLYQDARRFFAKEYAG
jgi:hypothetical protein